MRVAFAALCAAGCLALAGQASAAVFTVDFTVGPDGWSGGGSPFGLAPLVINGGDITGPIISGSFTGDTALFDGSENGIETLTALDWTTGTRTWTLADIDISLSEVHFSPGIDTGPSSFSFRFLDTGNVLSPGQVTIHDLSVPNGGAFYRNGNVIVTGDFVPEPASWALMLTGFFGLGGMLRRRRSLAA